MNKIQLKVEDIFGDNLRKEGISPEHTTKFKIV